MARVSSPFAVNVVSNLGCLNMNSFTADSQNHCILPFLLHLKRSNIETKSTFLMATAWEHTNYHLKIYLTPNWYLGR